MGPTSSSDRESSMKITNSASAIPSSCRVWSSSLSLGSSALALLYRDVKHGAWYLASIATRSPPLNLARSIWSCKAVAHFRTRASIPNVDALCRGLFQLSHSSQKKHLSMLDGVSFPELERVNFLPMIGLCSSGKYLFSALLSLVELNFTLQLLCQRAL